MRCATKRIMEKGAAGGIEEREVNCFWLNEEQALLVAAGPTMASLACGTSIRPHFSPASATRALCAA